MSVLIRIFTNYLQMTTIVLSFNVNFPDTINDIFYPIDNIGSSSEAFLQFDCLITDSDIKGFAPSSFIFKIFLAIFLPLILFFIYSIIWGMIYILHNKW
jgi:hypothetical protein